MEPDVLSHSPTPSSASASRPSRRRLSSSSTHSTPRPASAARRRHSEETNPISYPAFRTTDPGTSTLSLPILSSPTPANTREQDVSRQPDRNQSRQQDQEQQHEEDHRQHREHEFRDSGIDASTSTNRTSNRFSQSMPNLPPSDQPLMPPDEDRPDLWQNEQEPPTFRPRTRSRDAIAAQDGAANHPFVVRLNDDVRDPPRPQQPAVRRAATFLGYGSNNRYRKELIGLLWNLGFGFIQIAVTLGLIIYAGIHHSPNQPTVSEWTACDKPLGLWSCFWIAKVLLDCGMTYWSWRRDWKGPHRRQNRPEGDAEQGAAAPPGVNANANGNAASGNGIPDDLAPVDTNLDPPTVGAVERQRLRIDAASPHYRLYSRLSLLLSLIIISWFLTANVLVFSSLHSCRHDGPHLWWLVFSLLCLQYLVILEVLATAIIVFIIGPLIYLFWSIILICLGRHPIQNPHYITPEIGKVSKSVVDQIPLVLYIPTPPGEDEKLASSGSVVPKPSERSRPKQGSEHTYPPKQAPPKRRFAFLRKSSKPTSGSENNGDGKGGTGGIDTEKASGASPTVEAWEDCWESGEFPFVRLDPHRASCAICLLDFEEPKRRVARDVIRSWAQKNREKLSSSEEQAKKDSDGTSDSGSRRKSEERRSGEETRNADADAAGSSSQAPRPSTSSRPESRRGGSVRSLSSSDLSIRLEDAGEGAQPLRLLPCGHAFHKTCIDPWLTGVSGRCPTCQRPVLPSDPPNKKRRRSQRDERDNPPPPAP